MEDFIHSRGLMRPIISLCLVAVSAACARNTAGAPGADMQASTRVEGAGGVATFATTARVNANVAAVAAPLERAWQVLPAVYDSLGIPRTLVDPTLHRLGNQTFKIRRRLAGVALTRYLECGGTSGAPNAGTYDITMSVLTQLHPAPPDSTRVLSVVQASARSPNFTNSEVQCTSTGKLEERIATMLAAQAR